MTTFILLTIAIFSLVIIESIPLWVFLRKAKSKHTELWRHAGRPSLWSTRNQISAWPLMKYLQSRAYLDISNERSKVFAEHMRFPVLVGYYASWATFASIIVLLFFIGR